MNDVDKLGLERVGPDDYETMWDEIRDPPIGYDRSGNALNLRDWCTLFENTKYRMMRKTKVGDYEVSTVWIGADHAWGDGPPLVFETMVFRNMSSVDEESDLYTSRYSTEQQALDGHEATVREVEKRVGNVRSG